MNTAGGNPAKGKIVWEADIMIYHVNLSDEREKEYACIDCEEFRGDRAL